MAFIDDTIAGSFGEMAPDPFLDWYQEPAAPAPDLQPGLGGVPASAIDQAIAAPIPAPPTGLAFDPEEERQFLSAAGAPILAFDPEEERQFLSASGAPVSSLPGAELESPNGPAPRPIDFIAPNAGHALDIAGQPYAPGGNEAALIPHGESTGPKSDDDERLARSYAGDSEEAARAQMAWNERAQRHESELRSRADLEEQQRQYENHTAFQKSIADARAATTKLNEDAERIANQELDTSWHAGPGKTIAGILLGIVGGLVQSRQGGANQGLAIIDADLASQIDGRKQKMAAQRAELTRRGASIQQVLAFDMQQHEENVRHGVATYARAQSDIQGEMQKYDPRGKAAIQLGQTYAAIGQARQKALAEHNAARQKFNIEIYKLRQEDRKIAVTEGDLALKRAKEKAAGAGMGGGGGGAKLTPSEFSAMHPQIPATQLPPDNTPRTDKEYAAYFDVNRKGGVAAQTTGDVSGSERSRILGVASLKGAGGQPWLARDIGEAKELGKKYGATREAVSIVDELLAIRDRVGGESSLGNSDERQRMIVLKANLLKLSKSTVEGMSSDEDMKVLLEAAGADDVSSFRSQAAKLGAARARMVSTLNSQFQAAQYDGDSISFVNPYSGGDRKELPAEAEFKSMLGWQTSQYNYGKDSDVIKSHGSTHPEWDSRGYSDKQEAYVQAAKTGLESKDAAKAAAARARLDELAKHADSPGLKALAGAALKGDAPAASDGPVFK